jgi:hypothetical protein
MRSAGGALDVAIHDIHRRRADELRDEQVVGPVMLQWIADLLDPSCMTTIRSAIVIASTWSCVTYTVVVFSR